MSVVTKYCNGCVYLGKLSGTPCCMYSDVTGHTRRCAAGDGCDKRVLGKRKYAPNYFSIPSAPSNPPMKKTVDNLDEHEFYAKECNRKREMAEKNRALLQGRQKAAITEFRESHGWTVKEMAKRLGVRDATLSKWITEYNKANWEVLGKVGLSKPDALP